MIKTQAIPSVEFSLVEHADGLDCVACWESGGMWHERRMRVQPGESASGCLALCALAAARSVLGVDHGDESAIGLVSAWQIDFGLTL